MLRRNPRRESYRNDEHCEYRARNNCNERNDYRTKRRDLKDQNRESEQSNRDRYYQHNRFSPDYSNSYGYNRIESLPNEIPTYEFPSEMFQESNQQTNRTEVNKQTLPRYQFDCGLMSYPNNTQMRFPIYTQQQISPIIQQNQPLIQQPQLYVQQFQPAISQQHHLDQRQQQIIHHKPQIIQQIEDDEVYQQRFGWEDEEKDVKQDSNADRYQSNEQQIESGHNTDQQIVQNLPIDTQEEPERDEKLKEAIY